MAAETFQHGGNFLVLSAGNQQKQGKGQRVTIGMKGPEGKRIEMFRKHLFRIKTGIEIADQPRFGIIVSPSFVQTELKQFPKTLFHCIFSSRISSTIKLPFFALL